MARHEHLNIPEKTWTQITDADVTDITFQNVSGSDIWVKATTDTTAPTDIDGAALYKGGQGERNVSMSDLFPGLSGADRVWVYAPLYPARVYVSHA